MYCSHVVGKTFLSANGNSITAIDCGDKPAHVYVQFSQEVRQVRTWVLTSGQAKDYHIPSVLGVGFVGRANATKSPAYKVWSSMLTRCYSLKYHEKQPTYIGCTVCDDWKNFVNFEAWFLAQDTIGKVLDKDLSIPFNKVYSPETCTFTSQAQNNKTHVGTSPRKHSTTGILNVTRRGNKYILRRVIEGKRKLIAKFDSLQEAKIYVENNPT